MTHSRKSTKWLISMILAICVCIAVVVAGTFSLLTDTKTASGTITFNLADYDLKVLEVANSATGNIAPGYSGNTNEVRLVNTYARTTQQGTWAGMGAVSIQLSDFKVAFDDGIPVSCSGLSSTAEGITIYSSNGLTILLRSAAGTNDGTNTLNWNINGSVVSLSSNLNFTTEDTGNTKPYADIIFNIALASSTANNGFNSTDSTTMNNNAFQGQKITISYTASWAIAS